MMRDRLDRRLARASLLLILGGLVAVSGVAADGEFFERDGVAIGGYDPVAYFAEGEAVLGSSESTARYRGSIFWFTSPAHRDAFAADPEKYAPQYGGFCAFGVSRGYKAKIEPDAFTIFEGKLYLNYDQGVQKRWRRNAAGFIAKADDSWPEVVGQKRVIR